MRYYAFYNSEVFDFENYESLHYCLTMLGAKGFFGVNRILPSRFYNYLISKGYVFVERREK